MSQAVINEEVDPAFVIARLKREISDLKQEIRILKGHEDAVCEEDVEDLRDGFRKELVDYTLSKIDDLDLNKSISLLRYGQKSDADGSPSLGVTTASP